MHRASRPSRRTTFTTRKPERRRPPWGLVVLAGIVLAILVVPGWLLGLLPSLPNPFAEETIDRSQPAVLRSIRDLREFRAATGNFQVIVDIERDTALPSAILGERTLFLAVGSVDATVDFGSLGRESVVVSDDRRRATLTLPAPTLSRPRLDVRRSRVYDRDRGILNRIGDVFSEGGDQREIYVAAERKLTEAARETPGIRARAKLNTRAMLRTLLRSLGFTSVTVRFREEEL
ncbi:MAG: DUF4230 domain-containing protein [Actinomycetota bacterium]|nr:DUF4230 domain-containing protein [Actinomycetota bacterium]